MPPNMSAVAADAGSAPPPAPSALPWNPAKGSALAGAAGALNAGDAPTSSRPAAGPRLAGAGASAMPANRPPTAGAGAAAAAAGAGAGAASSPSAPSSASAPAAGAAAALAGLGLLANAVVPAACPSPSRSATSSPSRPPARSGAGAGGAAPRARPAPPASTPSSCSTRCARCRTVACGEAAAACTGAASACARTRLLAHACSGSCICPGSASARAPPHACRLVRGGMQHYERTFALSIQISSRRPHPAPGMTPWRCSSFDRNNPCLANSHTAPPRPGQRAWKLTATSPHAAELPCCTTASRPHSARSTACHDAEPCRRGAPAARPLARHRGLGARLRTVRHTGPPTVAKDSQAATQTLACTLCGGCSQRRCQTRATIQRCAHTRAPFKVRGVTAGQGGRASGGRAHQLLAQQARDAAAVQAAGALHEQAQRVRGGRRAQAARRAQRLHDARLFAAAATAAAAAAYDAAAAAAAAVGGGGAARCSAGAGAAESGARGGAGGRAAARARPRAVLAAAVACLRSRSAWSVWWAAVGWHALRKPPPRPGYKRSVCYAYASPLRTVHAAGALRPEHTGCWLSVGPRTSSRMKGARRGGGPAPSAAAAASMKPLGEVTRPGRPAPPS